MQIEIEKKYNLTDLDYSIIKDKCEFKKEITLKDYYLDKDFILAKNQYYLRLRNGLYELKKISFNPETKLVLSKEFEDETEIEKELAKFSLTTDEVTGIMFIETKREKYNYNYKGQEINIDVEEYQYGNRYEIEIIAYSNSVSKTEEDNLNKLIEDFRKEIGLSSGDDISHSKTINCAMHQNIDLYEIMTNNKI